jgi:hypothetical protein
MSAICAYNSEYPPTCPAETTALCSCCQPPVMVKVAASGTRCCHVSGKETPATEAEPELFQMRRLWGRYIRHLEYLCELH